jgi:hypothetical protein
MLGYGGLAVRLHARPTFRHFDPSDVHLPVVSETRGLEMLKIQHPWHGGEEQRVSCGRIILHDRKGTSVEAFTFGGALHIHASSEVTQCRLTSAAAILALHGAAGQEAAEMLVEEVEILLAERRAAWAHEPRAFDARLAACPALTLYASCLVALRQKLQPRLSSAPEIFRRMEHALSEEAEALRSEHLWPEVVPPLIDLL